MIAYRSTLDGGSGNIGKYTVMAVNNGVKTVYPGMVGAITGDAIRLDNANIAIGNNIYKVDYAFYIEYLYNSEIWFKGNTWRNISIRGFLNNKSDSSQANYVKNIHFHSSLNNVFNRHTGAEGTITNAYMTWTDLPSGNGFYNALYNIYCYNNYDGVS